jgi:hypothetical protein
MKHLLILIPFLITLTSARAQDKVIAYTGIVTIDSTTSKDVLFSRAKRWVAENFNSAQTVIQNEDKEGGSLILKAGFPYMQVVPLSKFDAFMHYTFSLSFKEGKFKYDITNFYPECDSRSYPSMTEAQEPNKQFKDAFGKKGWAKTKEVIAEKMPKMVDSLVAYMKTDKGANW